jgi:hypothetical protein
MLPNSAVIRPQGEAKKHRGLREASFATSLRSGNTSDPTAIPNLPDFGLGWLGSYADWGGQAMKIRLLFVVGALVWTAGAMTSSSEAAGPTMVDVAERLYKNATPDAFDRKCTGPGAKLEVEGDRHTCSKKLDTTIVRFAGTKVTDVTMHKKGIQKGVLGQIKRKLGAPNSVKTLGAMKMHFWFTKDATIAVAFQSSAMSRSTMVSFRSPS